MSSIKRSTPDVGYIDPVLYKSINVSQTVRANDTAYFSGIVAATGDGHTGDGHWRWAGRGNMSTFRLAPRWLNPAGRQRPADVSV